MDLSSLGSMTGGTSLLDYLDGGKLSGSAASSTALQLLGNSSPATQDTSSSGDIVSLSSQAQQLLAQIQNKQAGTTGTSTSTSTGVTKAAQNFIAKFFTDSGVDTTKLSDSTQKLLQGFQALVGDSGATTRDTATDTQEAKYNGGNRQVYTLVGDGRRIRIAVDYTDGKPSSMTLTDITSDGHVDSAKVSLTSSSTGAAADGVDVAETQYKYSSGILTDSVTKPVMSLDLYANSTGASAATA